MTATLNSERSPTATTHLKNHAPAYPHGKIEQLFWDIFWVQGSIRIGPGMSMNRNMIIIRNRHELTLINPVRLNEAEERTLKKLGRVTHVFRLGDFHGLDDQYYVDKYQARFWCQHGQNTYKTPTADVHLKTRQALPFPNAELFIFEQAQYPEAALLLTKHKCLLTTDSLQYLDNWNYTSLFSRLVLRVMGFKPGMNIGKPWLKRATPKGKTLESDFNRLMNLDFDHLLAAHGSPLMNNAKTAVGEQLRQLFN
ncbi:MAG: hypothetical protein LRY66_01395 [Saccharospirillaceae bacterium]|nr:hypothetical protein [Saccharospirillaceae bacterium]MCD8530022.1 hypothetical protein [Saccharospirillaceae bacterium]